MADGPTTAITDTDVRVLAAKLKGLHALLTPGQQALLHAVLRRAAYGQEARDDERAAWAVRFNPFPYLDAIVNDSPGREGTGSVPL